MISEKDLRDAIMRVCGIVIIKNKRLELSLDELQRIIDILPEVTGYFEVCSIHRDDLDKCGFIADTVPDEVMKTLASKMSDDYGDQMRDISMKTIAEGLNIPKKK